MRYRKQCGLLCRLMFIALALCTAGCLLLDRRNPEPPLQDFGTYTPALSAAELMQALEHAVVTRNPILYAQSFDPLQYRYYPEVEALARYGAVFDGYGYSREERFAQGLLSRANLPVDSISEASFEIVSEQPSGDKLTVEADYSIRLGLKLAVPRSVAAHAVFELVRGSDNGYVIRSWHDTRIGNDPGISEWKAVL